MKSIYILILIFAHSITYSQNNDTASIELKSTIVDHSGVQKFIESHKQLVKNKPFLEGFRIQIYNGNNKEDANKIKSEFYKAYSGMRSYLTYQQPYYKVRVGDYPDQSSAKLDLKKLARTYPSSFLVPDQIRRMDKPDDKEKLNNP